MTMMGSKVICKCIALVSVVMATCLGSEINLFMAGNTGEITSPNYPQDYPLNFTCTWTIQTSRGQQVRLEFLDFNIEKAKRCIYDSVQIKDKKNMKWSSKDVVKLCGNKLPGTFLSRGRFLQVRFQSDKHNLVARGFLARWKAYGGGKENNKECSTKVTYITTSVKHPCPTPSAVTVTTQKSCVEKIKPTPCICNKETFPYTESKTTEKVTTRLITTKKPTVTDTMEKNHVEPTKAIGSPNNVHKYNQDDTEGSTKSRGMREDKIILIVFIGFVSLLLLINVLLIFFLWKRNKQVGQLRMLSKEKEFNPNLTEYSDGPPPRRSNRGVYDYKAVPSTSSSSNATTVGSVGRYIERILKTGRYDPPESRPLEAQPSQQNQDKFLSMLTDVIRPAEVDLHSLSSDTNDGDISDEYVSTELSDHMATYGTTKA